MTIKKCERHFLFKHFSTHIDSNIFSQLDLLIHLTNNDLVQYLICSSDDSDLPSNSTKIHGTDLSIITKVSRFIKNCQSFIFTYNKTINYLRRILNRVDVTNNHLKSTRLNSSNLKANRLRLAQF